MDLAEYGEAMLEHGYADLPALLRMSGGELERMAAAIGMVRPDHLRWLRHWLHPAGRGVILEQMEQDSSVARARGE